MTSSERVQALIDRLGLQPHPEGGYYREVFRSGEQIRRGDGASRSALTTIFFLLPQGAVSRWHRVRGADEVWHHYEGGLLELRVLPPGQRQVRGWLLGPVGVSASATAAEADVLPVRTVPADAWQAARCLGDYALVGCTVGPGFDFADFTLASDLPPGSCPGSLDPELL
ncbi:cupin domain-containing protein [Hylemonella gracilis]|uniref:Cupin domain-containing protein n=1 Tax=Hylemonella gracilis TaxID=80880 RepID=A0A4P6UJN8_9BURK|nr:cupin domain-containing protein [Hylemonella gracilis]QBK04287.1 cupin domain-containing protein [Hylemonella gracilis]